MNDVETVIVGGGAMGTAVALALARRGREALLLERFMIGHDQGSSHGYSRILRYAYFEHPDYARLVQRAEPMWREIENESGASLMLRCGGVDIGPPDGELVAGSRRSCDELGLPHEYLERDALDSRFPFRHNEIVAGLYQPDACILAPTDCVKATAELARRHGAVIYESTEVTGIAPKGDGIFVSTQNESYRAKSVILAAGPWASGFLQDLRIELCVRRKLVAFFEPNDSTLFDAGQFPIFIYQSGENYFYGFPIFGRSGVKIGDHSGGDIVDPDEVDRDLRPDDERHIRSFITQHMPAADGPLVDHRTCLYTMTSDCDFIIDRHPSNSGLVILAGFSGHGFKFAPIVGEIAADLAIDRKTVHPIDRFRLSRF